MIYLAANGEGFELKNKIAEYFKSKGTEFEDLGPKSEEEKSDFPEFVKKLVDKVGGTKNLGILVSETGIGPAIIANKSKGIVAANCYNGFMAKRAREYYGANVLALGADLVEQDFTKIARDVVERFVNLKPLDGPKFKEIREKIGKMP